MKNLLLADSEQALVGEIVSQESHLLEMESLNEAIKLLDGACKATCREAMAIWQFPYHAKDHLEKQLKQLLRSEY